MEELALGDSGVMSRYVSEILRAISIIVAIEEREGRKTVIMMSKRRSRGMNCS